MGLLYLWQLAIRGNYTYVLNIKYMATCHHLKLSRTFASILAQTDVSSQRRILLLYAIYEKSYLSLSLLMLHSVLQS